MALRIEEVHKDKYVTNKESYLIFHLFFTNVCVLILFIDDFQKLNERAQLSPGPDPRSSSMADAPLVVTIV